MSEFKGTKGKWISRISSIGIDVVTNDDSCFGIVDFGSFKELDLSDYPKEEVKANALLISKAPEMLEMLEILNKSALFSVHFPKNKKK